MTRPQDELTPTRVYRQQQDLVPDPSAGVYRPLQDLPPNFQPLDAEANWRQNRISHFRNAVFDSPVLGRLGSAAAGLAQGAGMEHMDEAGAALADAGKMAARPIGRQFTQPGTGARQAVDNATVPNTRSMTGGDAIFAAGYRENPVSYGAGYTAGNVAGLPFRVAGTVTRGAAGALAQSPRFMRYAVGNPISRYVGGGAVAGGVWGTLDAHGRSDAGTYAERVEDAMSATIPSSLVGAVMAPAMAAGGRLLGNLAMRVPPIRDGVNSIREAVTRDRLQQPGVVSGERAADLAGPSVHSRGLDMMRQALRDDGVDEGQIEALAREYMATAGQMTPSGRTGTLSQAGARQAREAGVLPPSILTLAKQEGWDNTLALAREFASHQGPGRRLVARTAREINESQQDRVRVAADGTLRGEGVPRLSAEQIDDALRIQQQAGARTTYAELDNYVVPHSPELLQDVGSEVFQRGMQGLLKVLGRGHVRGPEADLIRQSIALADNPTVPLSSAEVARLAELARTSSGANIPRLVPVDQAPASVWDNLKHQMDDYIYNRPIGTGPSAWEAGGAGGIIRDIVAQVDDATRRPDGASAYQVARTVFRTDSQSRAAVQLGDGFWRAGKFTDSAGNKFDGGHSNWMARANQWTEPERQVAADAAFDQVMTLASDNIGSLVARLRPGTKQYSPELVQRMEALFGPEATTMIRRAVQQADATDAVNFINPNLGSQTQPRAAVADSAADAAAAAAGDIALTGGANQAATILGGILRSIRGAGGLTPTERETALRFIMSDVTEGRTSQILQRALAAESVRAMNIPYMHGPASAAMGQSMQEEG